MRHNRPTYYALYKPNEDLSILPPSSLRQTRRVPGVSEGIILIMSEPPASHLPRAKQREQNGVHLSPIHLDFLIMEHPETRVSIDKLNRSSSFDRPKFSEEEIKDWSATIVRHLFCDISRGQHRSRCSEQLSGVDGAPLYTERWKQGDCSPCQCSCCRSGNFLGARSLRFLYVNCAPSWSCAGACRRRAPCTGSGLACYLLILIDSIRCDSHPLPDLIPLVLPGTDPQAPIQNFAFDCPRDGAKRRSVSK
jgi:hypothetical protein